MHPLCYGCHSGSRSQALEAQEYTGAGLSVLVGSVWPPSQDRVQYDAAD